MQKFEMWATGKGRGQSNNEAINQTVHMIPHPKQLKEERAGIEFC